MSSNHLGSNTLPPDASTQSPSVPIDSRASSQSEDAQPTISEPGYRKHSLGDILQSPRGTDAKRFKSSAQVPSASQTGIQPATHALLDYEEHMRMLEVQNKKRRMMADGMIGISATGPLSNSTNVSTPLGNSINGRHREKPRIGRPSNNNTSKAPIVEKDPQKHSSPLPPIQSMLPPRELENLPCSGNHVPEKEVAARNKGLNELNRGADQLKRLRTVIEETKVRIDQEVDEIPEILLYIEQAKVILSAEEGYITQRQTAMIDKKRAEVRNLEAKFEELIAITNRSQKDALQKIKDDAISTLWREIDDLKKGEDPITRGFRASSAQLEGDLARVKGQTASLIEALEGLLEKLP
jgi:ElaB/YqjD/DUF883 family membrane-anchored ribosome-binding protein